MIEIIPKKIQKAPNWQKVGLYAVAALLAVAVLGYVLMFLFESNALKELQAVEDSIAQVGNKEEKIQEAEVLLAQKRIDDFAKLLDEHKKTSNFFSLLEETTHPKIWLTEIDLLPKEATAMVTGQTANFRNLGEQLLILRDQPIIKAINLNDLRIGDSGAAVFTFQIDLNPQIFNE